jgi:hypothetical protein
MKVEITNEFDATTNNYSFKKKVITIGRSKDCDISLKADGISRKHAEIKENADGSFSLTDLGSSNGSFINDEKLEPNKVTDFTFFFPAKLGIAITVSLLEDDGKSSGGDDIDDAESFLASQGISSSAGASSSRTGAAKSPITLEAPKSARSRSGGISNNKGRTRPGSKESKPKQKKNMRLSSKLIFFAVACYGYWEFVAKEEVTPPPVVVKKVVKVVKKKIIPKKKTFTFPMKLNRAVNRDKCLGETAKRLCAGINIRKFSDGAFVIGDTAFIVFNASEEYKTIKRKFTISKSDIPYLEKLAKKKQGIKFSKVLFIRNKYRVGNNSREDFANYISTSVLFNQIIMNTFRSDQELKNLAIITYREAKARQILIGQHLITKDDLSKLEVKGSKILNQAFKYAFLSGYKPDFKKYIFKYFNVAK